MTDRKTINDDLEIEIDSDGITLTKSDVSFDEFEEIANWLGYEQNHPDQYDREEVIDKMTDALRRDAEPVVLEYPFEAPTGSLVSVETVDGEDVIIGVVGESHAFEGRSKTRRTLEIHGPVESHKYTQSSVYDPGSRDVPPSHSVGTPEIDGKPATRVVLWDD